MDNATKKTYRSLISQYEKSCELQDKLTEGSEEYKAEHERQGVIFFHMGKIEKVELDDFQRRNFLKGGRR